MHHLDDFLRDDNRRLIGVADRRAVVIARSTAGIITGVVALVVQWITPTTIPAKAVSEATVIPVTVVMVTGEAAPTGPGRSAEVVALVAKVLRGVFKSI